MEINFYQVRLGDNLLYECRSCHALVGVDGRYRHADWHRWHNTAGQYHDRRAGEPFEAEADGMGPSRVPRFGGKR